LFLLLRVSLRIKMRISDKERSNLLLIATWTRQKLTYELIEEWDRLWTDYGDLDSASDRDLQDRSEDM
jgi:hypothetical protein